MPSEKPSSSSSSSRDKEKAAAAAAQAKAAGSSSSSKPSSSSDPRTSSSSSPGPSGSSSSAPKEVTPNQPAPYISANAWMSFFLFVCLVLVILQGPLGLSGAGAGASVSAASLGAAGFGPAWMGNSGVGWMGHGPAGWPCCGSPAIMAAALPWCAPQPCVQGPAPPLVFDQYAPAPPFAGQAASSQMGGQGGFAMPGGGAGWSWYADQQGGGVPVRQALPPGPGPAVQYQRPGVQVQLGQPGVQIQQGQARPPRVYQVQQQASAIPALPVQPVAALSPPPIAAAMGLANLENAFYPLLVAAIALLVIFDYCS